MWKTSVIGIISIFCLPCSVKPEECRLQHATYMPFLVRVCDAGTGNTIVTGSIITPISVLTVCLDIKDKTAENLQAKACQVHYSIGSVGENNFKQADDKVDPKGCIQVRNVMEKRNHPHCPETKHLWFEEEKSRYDIAVLIVAEAFRNYTESVPTLPFVSDIGTQLAMVDTFNTIRSERCEIPLYNGLEPKSQFQKHMSFRSMPLQLDCQEMCKDYDYEKECRAKIVNSTGFILCAKRVQQPKAGITWTDNINEDRDYYKPGEDHCKDLKHVKGAPLMCRGSAIGIVTECNTFGMVISTIFTLRVLLHTLVDEGFTEEVIYMDVSESPVRHLRAAFYPDSFQGTQASENFHYSYTHPANQGSLPEGLGLLTMNIVLLLVNNFTSR